MRKKEKKVGFFVCFLVFFFFKRIKSLDLHLKSKFGTDCRIIELGKLGKVFISKQDNGLQQKEEWFYLNDSNLYFAKYL